MKLSWNHIRKIYHIKQNFNMYKKYIGLAFYEILRKLKIKPEYFSCIKKDYNSNSFKHINKIRLYKNDRGYLKYLKKKKI